MGAQAVYGLGSGLVIPAEVGLVSQTVSSGRLQQANALQGLSRNIVGILGPAVGGAIVVAGSPGIALAVDSASFLVCAALLAAIRITPRARVDEQPSFVSELREGWREFTSRTWAVVDGAALRDREPCLRRLVRPRPAGREGGARRGGRLGDRRDL